MFAGNRMYQDVVTYSDFGIHRTGTEGDLKTSHWLHEQLQEAGMQSELMDWELDQFFLEECRLSIDGQVVESFPIYYPKVTEPELVRAFMKRAEAGVDLTGVIAISNFEPGIDSVKEASRAGALAVVLIDNTRSGLFSAKNVVPYSSEPTLLPVVIIGEKDGEIIDKGIAENHQASLSIRGNFKPKAVTYNVIGRINRDNKWIIVSTPISGWFTCGGERGSGVAVWLALARWAATLNCGPSWLFIGNSGHEYHYLGMRHFLEEKEPPTPDQTLCWLHIGANVPVYHWKMENEKYLKTKSAHRLYVHGVNPLLQPVLMSSLGDLSNIRFIEQPIGEMEHVIADGYSGFGIVSSNYYFHHPEDTAESTGPELLEPLGLALKQAFEEILREETVE